MKKKTKQKYDVNSEESIFSIKKYFITKYPKVLKQKILNKKKALLKKH